VDINFGSMDRNDILNIIQKSNYAVQPSKVEGLGLSIIEPLCMGVPVLTIDIPPMNEYIHHGYNGFLITPRRTVKYGAILNWADINEIDIFNGMKEIMKSDNKIMSKNCMKFLEKSAFETDLTKIMEM